jgi:hypothetical protein
MVVNQHLPALDLVMRMSQTLDVSLSYLAYGYEESLPVRLRHFIENINLLDEDKLLTIEQTVNLWIELDLKKNQQAKKA